MSFRPAMKQEPEEQERRTADSQESLILFSQETYETVALSQRTTDLLSEVMSEPVPVTEASFESFDTLDVKYELKVSFRREEKVTKSCYWTYSRLLSKVYMLMDTVCPFSFTVSRPVPPGCFIGAGLFYKRDEDSVAVPQRCPAHTSPRDSTNYNNNYPRHLIRSDLKTASYVWDDERPRVVVPFPTDGSPSCTFNFNFKVMCRNSCVGGMDRKPTIIVFSLENKLGILASCSVEVRICSCPGRDRMDEEKKEQVKMQGHGHRSAAPQADLIQDLKRTLIPSTVADCVPSKRLKLQDQNANGTYEIHVHSKRKFRILCGLKGILEYVLPTSLP